MDVSGFVEKYLEACALKGREMKPFFTAEDFYQCYEEGCTREHETMMCDKAVADIANAKVAPLVEENARRREALELVLFQNRSRGYPTGQEWIEIVDIARAALGQKTNE